MADVAPVFGVVDVQKDRIEFCLPRHMALQLNVCGGDVLLSYTETGRDSVIFRMTPAQCNDFAEQMKLAAHFASPDIQTAGREEG